MWVFRVYNTANFSTDLFNGLKNEAIVDPIGRGLVSMTAFAAEVPELPAAGDAEAGKR